MRLRALVAVRTIMAIACLLSFAAFAQANTAAASPGIDEYRRHFRQVFDGLRTAYCARHVTDGMRLMESQHFELTLSRGERYGFLVALNRCAAEYGHREALYETAERWVRHQPREKWPQVILLSYGVEFGNPQATLDAFEHFVEHDRNWLRGVPLSTMRNVLYAADLADPSGDLKLAVLESMERIKFDDALPENDDNLRFERARLLLARGRTDEARRALEGVTSVNLIALMRVDALFEPLRMEPAFASRLNPAAAIERDLARSRQALESHPESLAQLDGHAARLVSAGRYEEALALVEAALARVAADTRAYEDGHVHRRLLLETRGEILLELGRTDEAVTAMLDGANQREYRRQNVSQMLQLALVLVDLGRGNQALPLLPRIVGTSRREQAWVEAVRSCAGVQVGNESDRLNGLAYLRAHEADGPAALSRALLCSGDIEGAAALMIRRLGQQGTSASALLALQERRASQRDQSPFRKVLLERFTTLGAREDVRTAVAPVGRIEKLPINLPGGF